MKRIIAITVCLVCVVTTAWSAEKASQQVVDLANSTLAALGTNPVIIAAVQKNNAKGDTLSAIKALDAKWKAHAGTADYMQAILDNACSKELTSILDSSPYYAELFVMNKLGANVCMTDKTSDYWQGDEAKFSKSYNGAKGAVFVDDVEFDDSTQAYLVQVSVPVTDNGSVIGAITIGVDVDKL